MAQRKIILEELESLNSLKELAESYEEIAVIRMQKLKDRQLEDHEFCVFIRECKHLRQTQKVRTGILQELKTLLFPKSVINERHLHMFIFEIRVIFNCVT